MTMNSGFDREVRFEIVEHIGIISTHSTGWNKELNLVRWNGGQPKYDIRDWDMDHEHMSKGITLHEKEMRQMFDLMKKRRAGNRYRRDTEEGRKNEGPFDLSVEASAETPTDVSPEAPAEVPMQEEAI